MNTNHQLESAYWHTEQAAAIRLLRVSLLESMRHLERIESAQTETVRELALEQLHSALKTISPRYANLAEALEGRDS